MDDKIIPFGKHKGKPVEILATDRQYLDWLLAQSWFREKYLNIYNVVINNFREPVNTPEHNKMQIKFLNLEYRQKLAYYLYPEIYDNGSDYINNLIVEWLTSDRVQQKERFNFLESLEKPIKSDQYGLYSKSLLWYNEPIFERVDVSFRISYGVLFYYDNCIKRVDFSTRRTCDVRVEIKPTVSDDFPAILRQMKASMPHRESNDYRVKKFELLLVGEYTGIGATKSEFIEYFRTQGYRVIFEEEYINIDLPDYDKEIIIQEPLRKLIDKEIHRR